MYICDMKEIWKDIEGYEGLYQVSNLGRVRTLNYRRQKGVIKILKQAMNGKQHVCYSAVELSKNGTGKIFKVHRLVAMAFIPNPDNLPEVNHKDENHTNNVWTNLEWCNRHYQMNYGTIKKRIASHFEKPVNQIHNGIVIATYPSISKASEITKICGANIGKCCKGIHYKTAGGFQWQYAT